MRKLIIYPNLSMGGVTSVLRGRAAHEPDTQFDFLFFREKGGANAFVNFDNVEVRVCEISRIPGFLSYLLSRKSYDEISVLSHPNTANLIAEDPNALVTYEFHSSDMDVIKDELKSLEISNMARIAAPSPTMVEQIAGLLPGRFKPRVQLVPNLVDVSVFTPDGSTRLKRAFDEFGDESIPLVWVGRFDKGKGYRYFLRLLALLPDNYVGFVAVSLEDDPKRPTEFLNEANALNVANRVRVLSNLSRDIISDLYRSTRDRGGWLVSTSLMESFGYAVAEALACDLRVAAFELPPFHTFAEIGDLRLVPIGSVRSLSDTILQG